MRGDVPAEEHPVVADAQRVHICLIAVLQIVQHLRGHVEGRAQHGFSQIILPQNFREPEISNFGNSVMPQEVGQFQIPMKNLMLEEMVKSIDNLTEYFNGLLLGEVLSFLDIGVQVPIITVLQNKIVVIGGLLHIVQFDDVVALAAFENLYLALQQLLEFTYGLAWIYPLRPRGGWISLRCRCWLLGRSP